MTDAADLECWKCGASLRALSLPLRRLEECPGCRAELHVCRMCEFYDPRVAKSCREPIADEVNDKERANFCGYFTPRPHAHAPGDTAAQARARAELDALFGSGPVADAAPRSADEARARLEELFGKKPK